MEIQSFGFLVFVQLAIDSLVADPDLCPVVDVVFPEREVGLYVASGICLASAFCIADYLGGHAIPLVVRLPLGNTLWAFVDLLSGI